MTKLRHYDSLGTARFITFSCHRRLPLLRSQFASQMVVKQLAAARSKWGFRLFAYVIMPNHVHLIIFPPDSAQIGKIIGQIKRDTAHRIIGNWKKQHHPLLAELCVERNGRHGYAFWQRRCYDHNCRVPEFVTEKIDYCHKNPVKSGLVLDPADWVWSSYRWYCGITDVSIQMDFLEA